MAKAFAVTDSRGMIRTLTSPDNIHTSEMYQQKRDVWARDVDFNYGRLGDLIDHPTYGLLANYIFDAGYRLTTDCAYGASVGYRAINIKDKEFRSTREGLHERKSKELGSINLNNNKVDEVRRLRKGDRLHSSRRRETIAEDS